MAVKRLAALESMSALADITHIRFCPKQLATNPEAGSAIFGPGHYRFDPTGAEIPFTAGRN